MARDSDKLRIGFVGVGSMGQCAHLRNYATIPECEVAAIAELRPQTARQVAARYGITRIYRNHEQMFEHERLDAIVASQPFTRHGLLVPELLEYGKPLFIEKPLAATIASGMKICEAQKRNKVSVMVGYHKRSDPATLYTKAEIERLTASGELGKLTYIRILMPAGDWLAGGFLERIDAGDERPALPSDPPPLDLDEEAFGLYRTFVNYYIHQVNLVRHLLGEPYHVTYADPSGVLLVGRSDSGIPCTIEMSPYRTTVDWQESALIAFEKGWIRLELPAPLAVNRPGQVEIYRDPGNGCGPQRVTPQLPWIHAMRQQALNFLATVRGEIPPLCEPREALEDLQVAREYLRCWKGL